MSDKTDESIEQLRSMARNCDSYSPDTCSTIVEGIGFIAARHHLNKAADRIAALEAENARLRADADRLDFIERTFSGMSDTERYLPRRMLWGKGANGRTLREACDKYMAREAEIDAARGEVG